MRHGFGTSCTQTSSFSSFAFCPLDFINWKHWLILELDSIHTDPDASDGMEMEMSKGT